MSKSALILAAGKGTRMGGKYPKVMFDLAGKPLIDYVINSAESAGLSPVVVVAGFMKEVVEDHLSDKDVRIEYQLEQKGTGHAVSCGLAGLEGINGRVFVLCGDVPLLPAVLLREMDTFHCENALKATVLTIELDDPARYGRIVRENGLLSRIVEAADADEQVLAIKEINSGIYIFELDDLRRFIDSLDSENAQAEFYLTDLIEILKANGEAVGAFLYRGPKEHLAGINRPEELEYLEKFMEKK